MTWALLANISHQVSGPSANVSFNVSDSIFAIMSQHHECLVLDLYLRTPKGETSIGNFHGRKSDAEMANIIEGLL